MIIHVTDKRVAWGELLRHHNAHSKKWPAHFPHALRRFLMKRSWGAADNAFVMMDAVQFGFGACLRFDLRRMRTRTNYSNTPQRPMVLYGWGAFVMPAFRGRGWMSSLWRIAIHRFYVCRVIDKAVTRDGWCMFQRLRKEHPLIDWRIERAFK